jgi:hypothetical protein
MTDIKWPEGSTHKINNTFTKWIDGFEYRFRGGSWYEHDITFSLNEYIQMGSYEIITRPVDALYVPKVDLKALHVRQLKTDPPYVPGVGEWCENANPEVAAYYGKLSYIGLSRGGSMIMEGDGSNLLRFSAGTVFRPIKTDREKFIEKARESDGGTYSIVEIFGKLYDNGARFKEVSG